MKIISKVLFMVLFVTLFCSCDEPAGAAYVYGTVTISPGEATEPGDAELRLFDGSLSESGSADFYGYCQYKDNKLNFSVGHASESNIGNIVGIPDPVFISIAGVEGPGGQPVEGVYDLQASSIEDPDVKRSAENQSTFTNARLTNTIDSWVFNTDPSTCRVELFAIPIEGEKIFKNGSKDFDYYVRLSCSDVTGLTGVNGEDLHTMTAELFFENCS